MNHDSQPDYDLGGALARLWIIFMVTVVAGLSLTGVVTFAHREPHLAIVIGVTMVLVSITGLAVWKLDQ